jgi:hypothetical protein
MVKMILRGNRARSAAVQTPLIVNRALKHQGLVTIATDVRKNQVWVVPKH